MDVVLGIVVLVIVVWFVMRRARTREAVPPSVTATRSAGPATSLFRNDIDQAVVRDYGRGSSAADLRQVRPAAGTDHEPPSPTGGADEAWSPRTSQFEVAGEFYRAANLRLLFQKHAKVSESGAEIRLPATLVPDPTNPYDANAVAVHVDGLHVGYLERADAVRYHRAVVKAPAGEVLVRSRQWLRATAHDTWARVTLSLPDPEALLCPNPLSDGHVMLPPGSTVQVTGEEHHMAHLAPLLTRFGSEQVVAATLHAVTEQRPRSVIELVEVRIDGERVGVLSTAQTANFLPIVKRAELEGRPLGCRASLRGNALKADVALHARKTHEFSDDELENLFASP